MKIIDFTNIILVVSIVIVLMLFAFIMYSKMKRENYNHIENKAILDNFRKSFENQIYQLNDRLMVNEDRWKDVNHLLYKRSDENDRLNFSNQKIILSDFLRSNGITEDDLRIDSNLVFVLTPFNDNFYEDFLTVKDVCSTFGFKCVRGDEEFFKDDIFQHVLKQIVRSKFLIANINGRNSNVLYELGIAHALNKPVILISKSPNELPIDIKSRKFLIYKDYTELRELLRNELLIIPRNQ
jgi:hypothetical protein